MYGERWFPQFVNSFVIYRHHFAWCIERLRHIYHSVGKKTTSYRPIGLRWIREWRKFIAGLLQIFKHPTLIATEGCYHFRTTLSGSLIINHNTSFLELRFGISVVSEVLFAFENSIRYCQPFFVGVVPAHTSHVVTRASLHVPPGVGERLMSKVWSSRKALRSPIQFAPSWCGTRFPARRKTKRDVSEEKGSFGAEFGTFPITSARV